MVGMHYRIVDWDEHYEVDKDGRAWTAGKAFRQGPLDYVRVPARRDWNLKTLELQDEVGDQVWFYVGAFEKLCGIVGCEPRTRREGGVIRNSEGVPATREEIARMLRVKSETAEQILQMLTRPQTRWLEIVADEPQIARISATSALSANSAKEASVADLGENRSKSSQVKSEQPRTEQVKSKGFTPIADLVAHMVPVRSTGLLDDGVREVLDSTRLGFLCEMRRTLRAEERPEARTVSNFEQWVHDNVSSGRAGPELRHEALKIARDCVHGDRPVAVFLARAKRELGYIAPSRRPAAGAQG